MSDWTTPDASTSGADVSEAGPPHFGQSPNGSMPGVWRNTGQRAVRPKLARHDRDEMGTRFGETAATYDRVRPRYPDAVYEWLLAFDDQMGAVVDVGAGTGLFGQGLRERGWSVTGIDPDRDLLDLHPEPAFVGTAESIPLPDASVNLVTVAQAWHWIDPAAASAEFRRVLTGNGAVGIIVNQLDVRVEWVLRLARIMHAGDVYRPAWRPELEGFGPPSVAQFPFTTRMTIDEVVALASTRSYWLRSSPQTRDRVKNNLRTFLAGEGRALAAEATALISGDTFELPYLCLGYFASRQNT